MLKRFSRRRFLGVVPVAAFSLKEMFGAALGFVQDASLALLMQIRAGLGRFVRYRIETDRGPIEIQTRMNLTMQAGDAISIDPSNLLRLELPSEILLTLEKEMSSVPEQPTGILALRTVRVNLENANIVEDVTRKDQYQIQAAKPSSALTLQMNAGQWIPNADEDPVALEFVDGDHQGDDLLIRVGPGIEGMPSPVDVRWPPFRVLIAGSAASDKRQFGRNGANLVVHFGSLKVPGKHSFKVFEGKDPGDVSIALNDGADTFELAELAWTPILGQLRLSGSGRDLHIDTTNTKTVCHLDVCQTDTSSVVFAGERVADAPAKKVSPVPATVQVRLWNLTSPSRPLWNLLPADMPLQIGPYKGSAQTRPRDVQDPLVTKGELESVVFTHRKGKKSAWRVDQYCRSLGLRFAGLGAGGLGDTVVALAEAPDPGCLPEQAPISDPDCSSGIDVNQAVPVSAALNSDATGEVRAPAGGLAPDEHSGKYIVVSADQLLSLEKITCLSMDSKAGSLQLRAPDAKVNWAGAMILSKGAKTAWAVLKPLTQKPSPTEERRSGEIPVPGATLQWVYQSGSSTLVSIVAPNPPAPAQLTALDSDRFRAVVEPNSATAPYESCLVAPFTLREHPDEFLIPPTCKPDSQYTDVPAFAAKTMWEPRSKIVIDPAESLDAAMGQLADENFGGAIEFRNAGLAMTGRLMNLKTADWAANSDLPNLAPYKAVVVNTIQNTPSEDLISPCNQATPPAPNDDFRRRFQNGLGENGTEQATIKKAISATDLPIAISPIGGSIAFDWTAAASVENLKGLRLHSFLGRYERNIAIEVLLVVPWGLVIEVVFRLYRDVYGEMKYQQKWHFQQPEQTYGTTNPLRIYNLRPLNATTWHGNGEPLLFKADFDIISGHHTVTKKDVNLQGSVAPSDASTQTVQATVAFDDLPDAADTPRNVFDDTLMLLHTLTWQSTATVDHADITVVAHGELVQTGNLTLDSRAVSVSVVGTVNKKHEWSPQSTNPPIFQATRATVGPGMLRILPPGNMSGGHEQLNGKSVFEPADGSGLPPTKFNGNKTETSEDITANYELNRDIDNLNDVGFMQMLFPTPNDGPPKPVKGKLSIQFTFLYHKQNGQVTLDSQTATTTCKFPDLTPLNKEICRDGAPELTIGVHPKSFEATLSESNKQGNHYNAQLVADIGVPSLLAFQDSTFAIKDGTTSFHLGNFQLCPGVLKEILNDLFGKLNLLGNGALSLHVSFDLHGPEIGLSINLLPAGMGGGVLTNPKVEVRLAIHIDFGGSGSRCGFALFFNLGEYLHPDLSSLDWPNTNISLSSLLQQMLPQLRPVTLNIDPFVFRFNFILAVRRVGVTGNLEFGVCLSADAGLGVSFDVGVANGGASVTVGARFCPDPLTGFVVSVGVMIDAWATVLSIISIRLHAELFVSLYLGCPARQMIGHLVFSGYASITIAFVTISASFTVNLDSFLGLHPCQGNPGALASAPKTLGPEVLARHVNKCVQEFAIGIRGIAA